MKSRQSGSFQFSLHELFWLTTVFAISSTAIGLNVWWGLFFGGLFIPAIYRGRRGIVDSLMKLERGITAGDIAVATAYEVFLEVVILVMTWMLTIAFLVIVGGIDYLLLSMGARRIWMLFDFEWLPAVVFGIIHGLVTALWWVER